RRTFVILRPRSLPWDLLLCQGPQTLDFWQLGHAEASAAAQGLYRALREWAAGGLGGIEAVPGEEGCRLRVGMGDFALVVCLRMPGQSYAALACRAADAFDIAGRLRQVLSPAEAAEQEVYVNARHFDRPAS